MPALRSAAERLTQTGALRGRHVGIAFGAGAAAAELATVLRDVGAQVSVLGRAGDTTAGTVSHLQDAGVRVLVHHDENWSQQAASFLSGHPEVVLDRHAQMVSFVHTRPREGSERMVGATEADAAGARHARTIERGQGLEFPVAALHDSPVVRDVASATGEGQAAVLGLLDATNLQLAGRLVVVAGYTDVGRGVARHASALGARVVVSEADAVRALAAWRDGHRVQALAEAAPAAEVVFVTSGSRDTVTRAHVERLRDGVVLCNVSGPSTAVAIEPLATSVPVRPGVIEHTTTLGGRILAIDRPGTAEIPVASRRPRETVDLMLALHALAAGDLASGWEGRPAGVYPVADEHEELVAAARLAYDGATLEPHTTSD